MKLGTILKKIIIFLILLICIGTVIPLIFMLIEVSDGGWSYSVLAKLLDQLDS